MHVDFPDGWDQQRFEMFGKQITWHLHGLRAAIDLHNDDPASWGRDWLEGQVLDHRSCLKSDWSDLSELASFLIINGGTNAAQIFVFNELEATTAHELAVKWTAQTVTQITWQIKNGEPLVQTDGGSRLSLMCEKERVLCLASLGIVGRVAESEKLTERERSIVQAVLELDHPTGEQVAAQAGYNFTGSFKDLLSSMVKRGILKSNCPGYEVTVRYQVRD